MILIDAFYLLMGKTVAAVVQIGSRVSTVKLREAVQGVFLAPALFKTGTDDCLGCRGIQMQLPEP